MPVGSFRLFHKEEKKAWEQFLKLLKTLDTPSTAPDDSIILVGVKHDRELWEVLPTQPFKNLKLIKLQAPLEILRERLSTRLKPFENLQILYQAILVPGQEWVTQLDAHYSCDTHQFSAEEIVQQLQTWLGTETLN